MTRAELEATVREMVRDALRKRGWTDEQIAQLEAGKYRAEPTSESTEVVESEDDRFSLILEG